MNYESETEDSSTGLDDVVWPKVFEMCIRDRKDRLWDGFCMKFLQGLYIALWSLLLVIPGIVKTYSLSLIHICITSFLRLFLHPQNRI